MKKRNILYTSTMAFLFTFSTVHAADAVSGLLQDYKKAGVTQFSASQGKRLWYSNNNGRSCTTCHTQSVKNTGKHKKTGKTIKPMAPSVNPKRLTDKRKIKKWLLRNCKWTLKRECTAQEKGNILMWLKQQ